MDVERRGHDHEVRVMKLVTTTPGKLGKCKRHAKRPAWRMGLCRSCWREWEGMTNRRLALLDLRKNERIPKPIYFKGCTLSIDPVRGVIIVSLDNGRVKVRAIHVPKADCLKTQVDIIAGAKSPLRFV